MKILIEAAVESLDDALAAVAGGAHRLELCADLDAGGTTPDRTLIVDVLARVRIPVVVMVRPRAGDFVYSRDEVERMRREVALAVVLGAAGVVLGALTADRRVDEGAMHELLRAAHGLPVTFHRAIDDGADLLASVDTLRSLGVARVLTSGGAAAAVDGADTIAAMVERAGRSMSIVAGGGVRWYNVVELVRRSGVREVHARCGGESARIKGIADALAGA